MIAADPLEPELGKKLDEILYDNVGNTIKRNRIVALVKQYAAKELEFALACLNQQGYETNDEILNRAISQIDGRLHGVLPTQEPRGDVIDEAAIKAQLSDTQEEQE